MPVRQDFLYVYIKAHKNHTVKANHNSQPQIKYSKEAINDNKKSYKYNTKILHTIYNT